MSKTRNRKKVTTTVVYTDENFLWSPFYCNRSGHGNLMTPIRFSFIFVFLCTRSQFFFFKKKTLPTCFVLSARTTKFLFFMFSFMVYATLQRFLRIWTPLMKGQAQNIWRLNSQIWQDSTFVHCPLFVLNIPFYLLSLIGILFSLFICLDIFWRLVTTHATGTQIVRAKWRHLMRFFAGETSRALALSLAVAKNLSSTCGQV